jgi:hypothetical protein
MPFFKLANMKQNDSYETLGQKMPRSLSGKMTLILPFALLLALSIITATHRGHLERLAMFATGMLFTVPSCCAIAFCRSDKPAVIVFSLAVILLLFFNCLSFVPISLDSSD